MTLKDPDIFRLIEKIGDHYQNNVSNRFIRKAMVVIDLHQSEWDRLDNLASKTEYYKQQGFLFDELYEIVMASARFIQQARAKMLPNIRGILAQGSTDQEKVLREMAAHNLPANLAILADLVNELYMKTTVLDRAAHGNAKPIYQRITKLDELAKCLVNP